jgi:hypothetical protein
VLGYQDLVRRALDELFFAILLITRCAAAE